MSDPVVTIITSLPPASSTTPVVFTVVGGSTAPIRTAWASVAFPGIVGDEVIYNGARFGAFYTNGINSRASVVKGYQFTILRDGGWPVGAFPVAASFTINAVDTLGNGQAPPGLLVLLGNSNHNSQGVSTDGSARQDGVLTADTRFVMDKIYGTSSGEPVPLVDMGRGSLRVANVSTFPGFGPERFFGPEIFTLLNGFGTAATFANKPWLVCVSISGVRLLDSLKASSYGTSTPAFGGSNFYTYFVNRVKAARADSGREIGALISDLGPNDGANVSDANQVAARWVQMWSDLQSDLGTGFPLVLLQMNPNVDASFNPSLVRPQLVTAASSIAGCRLVIPDGLSLNSDNIHYGARRIATVGGMYAAAVRDVRGLTPRTSTVVAMYGYGQPEYSSSSSGAITFKPFPYPMTQDGQVQLLVTGSMKNSGGYVTIPSPTVPASGWTQQVNSTQAFGGQTQGFALFSRPTAQADIDANNHLPPNAQILLSNDENYCKLFTVFGPSFPVLRNFTFFSRGSFSNANQTVASINSTRPNALVVLAFVTQGGGASLTESFTVTNANLTNLTVFSDEPYGLFTSNFGILVVAVGTMVAPGAIGVTTISQTNPSLNFAACGCIGVVEDV
jgi:hypothetical protein